MSMTTQIGAKFVMQGYHQNRLIILGLNQDFIKKNPLLRVLQCGAPRLAKMAPILIIIHHVMPRPTENGSSSATL